MLRGLVLAVDLFSITLIITVIWVLDRWGWSWWSIPVGVLVIGMAGPPFLRLRPRLVAASQRAHGAWLLHCAYNDERAPILLLRSFRSAVTVAPSPTIRLFGRESPINDETSPAAAKSFLLGIATNLHKLGPLVAIGFSLRGHVAAPRLNVLYLSPSDEEWFELFELLSASCRAVVMLPGETESVVREYMSLRARKLTSRLLMVMPPLMLHGSWIPWIKDHRDDLERGWKETAQRFAAQNVQLPVYDPLGLVFIIDDDGRVTKSLSLKGHMLRLDRAIERLIPDAAIEVAPMHAVIRALERFHLPELRNAERGIR